VNKQEIETALVALRNELNKITNAEEEAKNTAFVGRCFKATNNYSCPENDEDYWYTYCRVTSAVDGLHVLRFEIDKYGVATVYPNEFFMANTLEEWEEITEGAWLDAWHECKEHIASLVPA